MKYLIMVYANPSTAAYFEGLSEAAKRDAARGHATIQEALTASGEFITAASLQGPATAKLVDLRGGGQVVTDGPFAEVKEHLAGFYLVDCADQARAVEIGAMVAAADAGWAEVRPIRTL